MMTHAENLKIETFRINEDKKDKKNKTFINGVWVVRGAANGSISSSSSSSSSSALRKGTDGFVKIVKMETLNSQFLLKEMAPVVQHFR